MLFSPLAKRVGGAVVVLAVLIVLRMKPWTATDGASQTAQRGLPEELRETLTVGFLPVT